MGKKTITVYISTAKYASSITGLILFLLSSICFEPFSLFTYLPDLFVLASQCFLPAKIVNISSL
jgi:hypothetical protein